MSLALLSCRGREERKPAPEPPRQEVSDMTAEAKMWADTTAARMDLRQKAAQLFMPALYASDDVWTLRQLREYARLGVGGIVLLKGDSRGAAALADTLAAHSAVLPFVAIDAEWGLAMRLADAPEFPANGKISPEAGDQLMYDYGRELARECRLVGINMVLGPVLDVNGGGGIMGKRSFGSDPERVADLGVAYARGLEDGGVISVAKHFPGHGSVSTDSHKRKGVINRSLQSLDSIDLKPFRRWVELRLTGVMVGHLAVPSIDSRMLPAAVSRTVITDLLREDLGFGGLVLTDALNMGGAEGYGSELAVAAGADIIVAPAETESEIDRVVQAVADGSLPEKELNRRVKNILFHKYLLQRGGRRPQASADLPSGLAGPASDTISSGLRRGHK